MLPCKKLFWPQVVGDVVVSASLLQRQAITGDFGCLALCTADMPLGLSGTTWALRPAFVRSRAACPCCFQSQRHEPRGSRTHERARQSRERLPSQFA